MKYLQASWSRDQMLSSMLTLSPTLADGSTKVYSFVATSEITSFDVNMMVFYDYLITYEGVSSSSCLITFEAGTEPFTGTSAVLSSNYYAVLN